MEYVSAQSLDFLARKKKSLLSGSETGSFSYGVFGRKIPNIQKGV